MWLKYLPVNQAWVFLFGEQIETANIIDLDGIHLFASRAVAVEVASTHGLTVLPNGEVK